MNLTQQQIDCLVHMSRIAIHTDDTNRAYHHAMIDAGWRPVVGTVGIMYWTNRSGYTSMSYGAATEFYQRHGKAPAPF